MAETGHKVLLGSYFVLDISGQGMAYVTSVSGLGASHTVADHKMNKDGKDWLHKLPATHKYEDLKVQRALSADTTFADWYQLVMDGKVAEARTSGSIKLLDLEGNPVAEWTFEQAWPSGLTVNSLAAESDDLATEEMTIVYEMMKRVS